VHSAPKGDDAATTFAEHDLSSFQRYILTILADESRYGLAIKRELEALYGDEVNHGRLYPNLDELVELGFIDKSELDKRTNQYELTDEGRDALKDQLEWELQRVDPPHGGDEA
jgi:DNA-binding PadR family transcriptional regulator